MGVNPTDPEVARMIEKKAAKLVGQFGIRSTDVEDIQQDLSVRLIEQADKLVARTASQATVLDRTLRNEITNLMYKHCAAKRDRRREVGVDDAPESALIDSDGETDRLIVQLDVREAITSLPAQLQPLARELCESRPSVAATDLRLTRGQSRYQMELIAKHFEKCGISPPEQPD